MDRIRAGTARNGSAGPPHVCTGTARDEAETSPSVPQPGRHICAGTWSPTSPSHMMVSMGAKQRGFMHASKFRTTACRVTSRRRRRAAAARPAHVRRKIKGVPQSRRRRRLTSARTRSRPRARTSAQGSTQWRSPIPPLAAAAECGPLLAEAGGVRRCVRTAHAVPDRMRQR